MNIVLCCIVEINLLTYCRAMHHHMDMVLVWCWYIGWKMVPRDTSVLHPGRLLQ